MSSTTTNPSGLSSYSDCVASLRASLSYLESSVSTLDNGVSDFPRLVSVLKTVRHYELIPQPTLAAAESSLQDEIGPSIAALLDRADAQLERQARRTETLKARAELQAGRLSSSASSSAARTAAAAADKSGSAAAGKSGRVRGVGRGRTLDGEAALRGRMVRQRKEALKYSVERMEMEVGQKERELRVRLGTAG